jgi:hypothetical protein
MSDLRRKLIESVIRAEINKLQERIDFVTQHGEYPRLARYRMRVIRNDFAKLERVARRWGLQTRLVAGKIS